MSDPLDGWRFPDPAHPGNLRGFARKLVEQLAWYSELANEAAGDEAAARWAQGKRDSYAWVLDEFCAGFGVRD